MKQSHSANIPASHLFTEEDLHLFDLQNIFAASSLWFENGMADHIATFDISVRELPKNRNFLIAGGLEEVLEGIRKWRYSSSDIRYLQKAKLITPGFAKYLRAFRFRGDIYAMPEGTIFFPGEPVLRIVAPIIHGNLLTMFLMAAVTSNTVLLSKMIRSVIAAKGKKLILGGGLRAISFEAGMKSVRSGCILTGKSGMPGANRKYHLSPQGFSINIYHAVIKSFPSELAAMRAGAALFPQSRPMVDTYHFETGVKNAITVAKELRKKGKSIASITIDSGDLHARAVKARKMMDAAGFPDIGIVLASNLDEWKIAEHIAKKTPADAFLVQTEINAVADDPRLECVYKLAEIRNGRNIRNVAKFSKGKTSYPGRKQAYRVVTYGRMHHDVIGLEKEHLGTPLLKKVVSQGRITYQYPSLEEIGKYIFAQIRQLPPRARSITSAYRFPVHISEKLKKLMRAVEREEH